MRRRRIAPIRREIRAWKRQIKKEGTTLVKSVANAGFFLATGRDWRARRKPRR